MRSQKFAVDDDPLFSVSRMNIGEFEILPTPLLGDANGDGKVNIRDVTAIQRKLANYDEPGFNEAAADINGEGLDINDATLIQKYLAEYDLPYSIGERIA